MFLLPFSRLINFVGQKDIGREQITDAREDRRDGRSVSALSDAFVIMRHFFLYFIRLL